MHPTNPPKCIGPHRTYHRSGVTGTRMANWARILNKNYQTRKLAFRLNYIQYLLLYKRSLETMKNRMFTVFMKWVWHRVNSHGCLAIMVGIDNPTSQPCKSTLCDSMQLNFVDRKTGNKTWEQKYPFSIFTVLKSYGVLVDVVDVEREI